MPPLRTCSIGKYDSSSLTVDFLLSESVHSVSEADVALPNTVDVCGAEHFSRVQRHLSFFNCARLPCPALIMLFYVPFNLLLSEVVRDGSEVHRSFYPFAQFLPIPIMDAMVK